MYIYYLFKDLFNYDVESRNYIINFLIILAMI